MYSHTGRNKQCERKTNTCFYSFSMKNVNTSQTGTYYCAVAACGHILFGNGTKLVFEDSQSGIPDSPTANPAGNQKEDNLHYAALRANQSNRSRKQKNRQNECVYSTVRS
ncbi:hypothetical protein D4764_03G0002810 [Takifugu flavidus]|uniref:Immunoglobulin V-set domain-containing protein n=1 Tax=Takifugu flavidus TaxID=433684 RepID=A0A5C6N801_9TELE|nr:hypothetical protein D4764_03G0002810 [Takifugu flavidus]